MRVAISTIIKGSVAVGLVHDAVLDLRLRHGPRQVREPRHGHVLAVEHSGVRQVRPENVLFAFRGTILAPAVPSGSACFIFAAPGSSTHQSAGLLSASNPD